MRFLSFTTKIDNVHAAALILGAASLLSKLLGVLRDRMLAGHFGAGRELDMYYAAFQIPDAMSVLFLLGAGSAAILPVFQEYLHVDREKGANLITRLAVIFSVCAIVVIGFLMWLVPYIVSTLFPRFSHEEIKTVVFLSRIILFSPLLLGLSSIYSSVLQSYQRFFAYAAAPVCYNLGIIAGIFFLVPRWGINGVAVGVITGALVHFFIQFFTASRLGFGILWENILKNIGIWFRDEGIRRVVGLSFPRVLGLMLSQLMMVVLVAIAATLGAGSITIFVFAYNLYFVPVGIFGVSYAVTIFPRLSRAYLLGDHQTFFREFLGGIRTLIFWLLPSAALFLALRFYAVRVAVGGGAFVWEHAELTAATLAVLSVAMAAGGITLLCIRAFYALERTWTPLWVQVVTLFIAVNVAVSASHMFGAGYGGAVMRLLGIDGILQNQVIGLALGFITGITLDAIFLSFLLLKTASGIFTCNFPRFSGKAFLTMGIGACAAWFGAYIIRISFSPQFQTLTLSKALYQGVIAGIGGLFAYTLVLFLLRSEDLFSVVNGVKKKLNFFREA